MSLTEHSSSVSTFWILYLSSQLDQELPEVKDYLTHFHCTRDCYDIPPYHRHSIKMLKEWMSFRIGPGISCSPSITACLLLHFSLLHVWLWGITPSYVHWVNSITKNEAWQLQTQRNSSKFYKEMRENSLHWQSTPEFCFGDSLCNKTGFCTPADEKNHESPVWVQVSLGPGGTDWTKDSTFYKGIHILKEEKEV